MTVIRLSGIDKENSDNVWKIWVRRYCPLDSEKTSRDPRSIVQMAKTYKNHTHTRFSTLYTYIRKAGRVNRIF